MEQLGTGVDYDPDQDLTLSDKLKEEGTDVAKITSELSGIEDDKTPNHIGSKLDKSTTWASTPCVKDQAIKFPDTVVWDGGTKVKTFVLPDKEDELNELYSRITPSDSDIQILDERFEPIKETLQWMVVIRYADLKFKQVVTNGNE